MDYGLALEELGKESSSCIYKAGPGEDGASTLLEPEAGRLEAASTWFQEVMATKGS